MIAVGSVHGSPGATTLALDIARSCGTDVLLFEADPDGGCLAARLDLAVRPGLTELAGAARVSISAGELMSYAQASSLGIAIVVAHPAAEQVHAALRAAVNHIGSALRGSPMHVVVDVGRLRPGSPSLALAALADRTVIVSDNSVEAVVSLNHRSQLLRSVGDPVVVLTSARPYSAADVESASGQHVWGVVSAGVRRSGRRRRTHEVRRLVADCLAASSPDRIDHDTDHGIDVTA